ncbi:MAG TPA: class I SAM-dependent methyltransferase [Catalimonadaceae bacterium]|nr:class I SAM-dependent methyltransferase [Catalimonadaceae bacterium]
MNNSISGVRSSYNLWAGQYDTNLNKTRDLEAVVLRTALHGLSFGQGLEMGCGTGKNTSWLMEVCDSLTAIDFSEEMLAVARQRIPKGRVRFLQADILDTWPVEDAGFDLITFSLVLEHVEDLNEIFRKASMALKPGGMFYVGELHPFRQYSGSKARFETEDGLHVVTCFTHHISDFFTAARSNGFEEMEINEYFDDYNRNLVPRILCIKGRKRGSHFGGTSPEDQTLQAL